MTPRLLVRAAAATTAVAAAVGATLALTATPASACQPEYCPPPPPWCDVKYAQKLGLCPAPWY